MKSSVKKKISSAQRRIPKLKEKLENIESLPWLILGAGFVTPFLTDDEQIGFKRRNPNENHLELRNNGRSKKINISEILKRENGKLSTPTFIGEFEFYTPSFLSGNDDSEFVKTSILPPYKNQIDEKISEYNLQIEGILDDGFERRITESQRHIIDERRKEIKKLEVFLEYDGKVTHLNEFMMQIYQRNYLPVILPPPQKRFDPHEKLKIAGLQIKEINELFYSQIYRDAFKRYLGFEKN